MYLTFVIKLKQIRRQYIQTALSLNNEFQSLEERDQRLHIQYSEQENGLILSTWIL